MADRKVTIHLKVNLILRIDEGIDVNDAVNELDYEFSAPADHTTVEDFSIEDYEVIDSK